MTILSDTIDLMDDDDEDVMRTTNEVQKVTNTSTTSALSISHIPSCAYASAWSEVLQFALRTSHCHLWTFAELQLLQRISSLSFHALRLFGRLLLRKAAWVKRERLLSYVKIYGEDSQVPVDVLQLILRNRLRDAIDELVQAGLLQTVSSNSTFEEGWEVATMVLNMEDWQIFHKRFLSVKLTSSNNKEDTLANIKKMIISQRTCFGTSVKDQFVKSLLKYWKERGTHVDPPVQVPSALVVLMRRLVRFFHITTTIPSSSGVISVHQPIEAFAPLMASFRIVQYPKYSLQDRSCEDQKDDQCNLFSSQHMFHQWEAVVELHAIFEVWSHVDVDEEKQSNLQKTLEQHKQSIHQIAQVFETTQFVQHLTCVNWTLSRLMDSIVTSVDTTTEIDKVFVEQWLVQLSYVIILCFVGFSSSELRNEESSDDEKGGLWNLQGMDYLIRYHPATQFAYMLHEIAAIFEKEANREYTLAILLYEVLLLTPFAEHRRGKWYKRLCIDYEHLKMTSEACTICVRGLKDGNLLLSDEIDLQDRWQVLHKRLLNQQSTSLRKASSTAKGSRKSSTVLVVDTEALPENISEELDVLAMLLTALNPPSTTSNKMVAKLGKQQHGEEKSRNQLMTMLSLLLHQLLPKISLPVEALDEKQNNGSGAISVFSSSTKPRQQLPDPAPSCHKDTHTNSNTKMATPMSSKSTWICHICTFLNTKKALLTKFSKHQCVMCQAVYSEEVPTVSTVEVLKIKASPTPKKSDVIDLLESSEDEVEEVKKTEVTPLVNSNPANNATCKEPIAWRYRDVLKCLKSDSAVILSPSELPLSKSNVSKKKDDDLLTACFKVLGSNQDLTADSINLQSFTIHGRRFGDPKRKGKNKFCGIHDELLFVEDLVMQKCRIFDHDESKSLDSVFQIKDVEGEVVEVEDEINSHDEVQAGGTAQLKDFQTVHYQEVINEDAGWQGWHCEGGILRTLFGVCMWDVLFADLPHVFLTAYQDLPLDFPYPSFYFSREQAIHDRVKYLATCPDTQLAEDIARVYNTQKDSCCRLVQWSGYSLRALQLAAICLGGKALASLCLAMSINFKQFSSGAPDLFLVRVRAKFISQQQTEQYVTIPLEYLLGYEWNKRRGKGSNSAWDDGDDLLTPTATSAKSKSNNKRGRNWQRNAIEEDVQQPVAVEEETEYELLRSTKKHRNTNGSRTANGTADMSAEEIQDDSTLNAEEIEAAVIQIAAEESLVMPDYETILRIQRLQQSQENSHGTEEDDLDRMYGSSLVFGESSSKNEEKDVNIPEIEFVFESMSVEVKGPTDHLAYKQLFWLKLLSLPFFDRHKAFVCHVKETE